MERIQENKKPGPSVGMYRLFWWPTVVHASADSLSPRFVIYNRFSILLNFVYYFFPERKSMKNTGEEYGNMGGAVNMHSPLTSVTRV